MRIASYAGRERPRLLDRPNDSTWAAALDITRRTSRQNDSGVASGHAVDWRSRGNIDYNQDHLAQAACALVDVALRFIRWIALRVSCASFGDVIVL